MTVPAHRRRVLSRLAVGGVTTTLLLGAAATTAQAASLPSLTRAQAKASLPTSKSLPGAVKLSGTVRLADVTFATPCTSVPTKVTLPAGQAAIADYTNSANALSAKHLEWEVGITVFPSTAKATAALAKLNKAEKGCPKTKTLKEDGVPTTVKRTLSAKTKVGAWSGFATIDHISATAGTTTVALRGYTTYVVRGNTLVYLEELGTETATNGKLQATQQKKVLSLVLGRVAAQK